jgi:protein involved in polysaccharide export with SLBB domain
MTAIRHALLPLLAGAALFAGGCHTASVADGVNRNPAAWRPPVPADLARSGSVGSRPLRADDTVEIALHIPAGKQSSTVSDVVDQFGVITLPLVGDIKVGSLTTSEAEKAIVAAYIDGGYYQKIDVTVVCQSMMQERLYYVEGSVNKRGSFQWTDNLTLRSAIINAGGVNDFANRIIELTRGGVTTKYDLNQIERGTVEDPPIQPGDILKARERWL